MIAVSGPESSGTRLMVRILQATGAEVIHSPLPVRAIPAEADQVVVMTRDENCMALSQLRTRRASSLREALLNIDTAYALLRDFPTLSVSYEELVSHPQQTIEKLCAQLDLPYPQYVEEIQDGNAKYWEVIC